MPPLVAGAIIEEENLSSEDVKAALALRLKLIPIRAAPLVFPERTVVYDNITLRVPDLSIAVSPAPAQEHSAAGGTDAGPENSPDNKDADSAADQVQPPFPEFDAPLASVGLYRLVFRLGFAFFVAAYKNIFRTAENIWNRGYSAEALALLRQNERDHFGPLFFTLRRQAEQNLGLDHTEDEPPRTLFFGLSVFCFSLVLIVTLIYFLRGAVRKKWLTAFAVLLLITILPALYFGVSVNRYFLFGSYRPAVLKQTGVRLVPDTSGEIIAYFREGQPVKVSGKKDFVYQQVSWVWIQANDQGGLAGWVPEDRVVYY
jgi:hypothetical protein